MTPRNLLIRSQRATGRTYQDIAEEHGVTRERIRQITHYNDQPKRRVLRQSRALFMLAIAESVRRFYAVDV